MLTEDSLDSFEVLDSQKSYSTSVVETKPWVWEKNPWKKIFVGKID